MIHQLKLQASFFEEKIKGLKPWELRVNDRGFKVGDYIGENAGLHVGWVILTTEPCKIIAHGQLMTDVDAVYPIYN